MARNLFIIHVTMLFIYLSFIRQYCYLLPFEIIDLEFITGPHFCILFVHNMIAIGCSDLVPPENTWLRRTNNEVIVGCYSSRQTWHLRCTGNQWIGVIGNCTRGKALENC